MTTPKHTHVWLFSLLGGLLLTIMPLTVTLDHWDAPQLSERLLSLVILLALVVVIFYVSIMVNLRYYASSPSRRVAVNAIAFTICTTVSILVHYPLWEHTMPSLLGYYIRDELVRNITIFVVSYMAAHMVKKQQAEQKAKMRVAQLERENLAGQVQGLMQQLNPHFLFNSLNTLSGIVRESPEKSELFIDKLSQVYRYVLSLEGQTLMPLDEELRFMNDYVLLLHIRFEDRLFINVDNQSEGNLQVVPLSTQLLIENVIKHNIISSYAPMHIVVHIDNEWLTITNDYQPKKTIVGKHHVGLKNLDARCRLITGNSIRIAQNEKTFSVSVPLLR
jgi:LytS/YehU family sensor histidine kinase